MDLWSCATCGLWSAFASNCAGASLESTRPRQSYDTRVILRLFGGLVASSLVAAGSREQCGADSDPAGWLECPNGGAGRGCCRILGGSSLSGSPLFVSFVCFVFGGSALHQELQAKSINGVAATWMDTHHRKSELTILLCTVRPVGSEPFATYFD